MKELTTLLKQIVAINSTSGQETKLASFIVDWMSKHHLKAEIIRGNVVVRVTGKDKTKALIFNGHMDTVLPGALSSWETNPFSATIKDNKLFGLGSCDMKAGLACMMQLAAELEEQGSPLDIWFCFVTKEEIDGSGTKKFLSWFSKYHQKKYQKISAIIGEPTNTSILQIGQRGNAFIKVTIKGDSGHGSRPDKIEHQAIKEMLFLQNKLQKVKNTWQSFYKDKYLGFPSVAMTGLKSGTLKCPNKIPATCSAFFDIRTTPLFEKKLDIEINKWLKGTSATYSYISKPGPCGWCNPEAEIIKSFVAIKPDLGLQSSMGAADQCFFSAYGIDAVIYGPGDLQMAHQTNEYVELSQLDTALEVYRKVIYYYSFGKIKL